MRKYKVFACYHRLLLRGQIRILRVWRDRALAERTLDGVVDAILEFPTVSRALTIPREAAAILWKASSLKTRGVVPVTQAHAVEEMRLSVEILYSGMSAWLRAG